MRFIYHTWVSPNGVNHLVLSDGRCETCGFNHHRGHPDGWMCDHKNVLTSEAADG